MFFTGTLRRPKSQSRARSSERSGSAMPTTRENILAALHARLSALPATVLRGEVLPERVSAAGLLILRGGEPGESEVPVTIQQNNPS